MQAIKNNVMPAFGAPIKGGFYAGSIIINGEQFGVVVAPKSSGEHKGSWGERGKQINASSAYDGESNTAAMLENGSDIAKWVTALEIDGHKDWFIPSRDELELIYRNLKPSTANNYCSFRDGDNPSSLPPGQMYEEEIPAQTTAHNFQSDNDEAMAETWYWSSTQSSANLAFIQDFGDGTQISYGVKDDSLRVRAVRRFKVIN